MLAHGQQLSRASTPKPNPGGSLLPLEVFEGAFFHSGADAASSQLTRSSLGSTWPVPRRGFSVYRHWDGLAQVISNSTNRRILVLC
jgi:hypothetical protein